MKNHIRILGWLYILVCGLLLAAGIVLCVALSLDKSASSQKAFQFIAPPILFIACVGLIPGLVGGIGLLCSRRWARQLLFILSALLLLLVPVGTALGIYSFWVFWNLEVETYSAKGKSGTVPPSVPESSPLLRLFGVMACVAAGFFIVIKLGFILHNEPQPAPFDSPGLTGAAILVLVTGTVAATISAGRYLGDAAAMARIRRESRASASRHLEIRRLRVAELAADSARAKYAPLVERGEDWSDENIAYDQNREMTVTCEHLEPIERAMRRAGLYTRRYRDKDVMAQCRIDYPALQQSFGVAPPVRYAEFYQPERSAHDHPTAFLICDDHASIIHTMHPDESRDETAMFPSHI